MFNYIPEPIKHTKFDVFCLGIRQRSASVCRNRTIYTNRFTLTSSKICMEHAMSNLLCSLVKIFQAQKHVGESSTPTRNFLQPYKSFIIKAILSTNDGLTVMPNMLQHLYQCYPLVFSHRQGIRCFRDLFCLAWHRNWQQQCRTFWSVDLHQLNDEIVHNTKLINRLI